MKSPLKNPPGKGLMAGMDEAGRGSWAGPVVAAAVILPPKLKLPGLSDSKLLTPAKRALLFQQITKKAPYGVGLASAEEVDRHGLTHATFLAFQRALQNLPQQPIFLWIDGRDPFKFAIPHRSVIRGDGLYRCIAAASIIAKVTRDEIMIEWARAYPHYGFEQHKGYGTQRHQHALQSHGPCNLHRQSYAPLISLQWHQEAFL